NREYKTVLILFKMNMATVFQESCPKNSPPDRWQYQRIIRPVENVQIYLVSLLCCHAPWPGSKWAATRAVNCVPVFSKPRTDLMQPRNEFRLYLAGRHRANVQQKICVVPCRFYEILNQGFCTLEPLVFSVVTPGTVYCLARLERQRSYLLF